MEEVRIPSKNQGYVSAETNQPNNDNKKSSHSELFSVLGVLILAPIIAIVLTLFVFQSYVVDGESMEKTLSDKDRLIIWKAPKTFSDIIHKDYLPDRFSIVIFHSGATGVSEKQLIKRVIGIPGDRVVIKDGIVTVFNEKNPDGFFPDRVGPESSVIGNTSGRTDYTVKQGEIFVLGDNRDNSFDSRSFGPVDSESLVGTLAVRIFPFDSIKKF